AVKPGFLPSQSTTQTYFIGSDFGNRYTFPVVSIVADKRHLFDYNDGFITAGADYEEWRVQNTDLSEGWVPANWQREGLEYPATFEYFDKGKNLVVSQNLGIRVHGGWSRARRKKSFRLYPRNGYGNDALQYPFFQQSTSNSFRRLILRNSGNDETTTLFRDAFMQDLVKHMKFDIQLSEPTIVFLNGEYNGVYNIREFQNRHYIERKYGVTPQELDLLSNGLPSDGDRQAFVAMINFLHNNPLTDTANVTELNTRIDIANFIDYVIAQIYIRNTDWPGNNVKCWRKRTTYTPNAPEGHDGRFRWLAFDTDFGFGLDGGATSFEHNSLSHAQAFGNVGIILNYLFFNDSLIHYFAHRYADMLNTTFQPDFVIHLIDSMADIYRPEIQENIDRWDSHPDLPNWEWMVEIMRIFARNRPEFAREHLRQEFQLSPERELTLALSEPDAGYMHCNTIIVRPETRGVSGNPFPWVGHYYDSIPIPLKAVANPGYVFSHWTVGNDTIYRPDINLVLNSDTLATAHFHRDTLIECTTTSIWELAECPYGFHYWSANSFPGSAPPASRFVFFNEEDPTPTATILGNVAGRYDLDSRTRINGLGERGISFVNTGNLESNPGYAPTRLGGLLVTLNTENVEQAYVQWTAETVVPASRTYGVQLEYRIGTSGAFQPVLDEMGNIMRYVRDAQAGQEKIIGPVALPNNMLGQPCVQLLWRYYYTGTRISEASGARDEIRIDDIFIVADSLPNRAQRRTEIFTDPNILGPLWVDRGDTIRYTTTSTLPNGAYRWWVENGTLLGANHLQEVHVLWDHQKSTGSIGLEVASKDACTLLGYEDIFISNLQITESESNLRAALFPNPNNGRFSIYIKPEVKGAVQGRLLNSHGAVIDHLVFLASGKHSLRYNLSPGVYFVHLFQASGDFSTTLKFIVEPN
ncbi:MAG: CotH kinase family protein, partial [Schleiferiaceae bacterium]|nr:CotH kinase family protein [Schleiferiaceae bacterium]